MCWLWFCNSRLLLCFSIGISCLHVHLVSHSQDQGAVSSIACKIASFLTPSASLFAIDVATKKIVFTGQMPYQEWDLVQPIPEVVPRIVRCCAVPHVFSRFLWRLTGWLFWLMFMACLLLRMWVLIEMYKEKRCFIDLSLFVPFLTLALFDFVFE